MALSGHWNVDSVCGVDKCGAAVRHETVSSMVGNLAWLMVLTCWPMWWIVVGSSVVSLVEMEAVNFYRRESAALKVSEWLFERESPAALVVEWTALQKRVDSVSEVVGSSTERRDRHRLFNREAWPRLGLGSGRLLSTNPTIADTLRPSSMLNFPSAQSSTFRELGWGNDS